MQWQWCECGVNKYGRVNMASKYGRDDTQQKIKNARTILQSGQIVEEGFDSGTTYNRRLNAESRSQRLVWVTLCCWLICLMTRLYKTAATRSIGLRRNAKNAAWMTDGRAGLVSAIGRQHRKRRIVAPFWSCFRGRACCRFLAGDYRGYVAAAS